MHIDDLPAEALEAPVCVVLAALNLGDAKLQMSLSTLAWK